MSDELVALEIKSVLTSDGAPYVSITAVSKEGNTFHGNLDTALVRGLGATCFTVAEQAELENIIYNLMKKKYELNDASVGSFILEIRKLREE